MVTTTRRRGINASAAIKVPCIAASTGNLTLSGEQTVDGIALVEGDRVFAKDQTDTTEIGIYQVSTGTWTREPDFDGAYDVVEGTIVPVSRGTANSDTYWKITNIGDIDIGTTALTVQATTVLDSAILNDGSVKMIADFSPQVTDTYDLGTTSLKWQDLHLSGVVYPGGDTAAGDDAALGYTATEGVILTGQGSVNDITIKNDAGTDIMTVATGTVDAVFAGSVTTDGNIVFPATANPSADANTLDDYEEGTFTPVLDFGGGTTGITYSQQVGAYTKIGNVCHCYLVFTLTSKGSSTGNARISGFPFNTPASNANVQISGNIAWSTMTTTLVNMSLHSASSTDIWTFKGITAAAATSGVTLQDTDFANTTTIALSLSYIVG